MSEDDVNPTERQNASADPTGIAPGPFALTEYDRAADRVWAESTDALMIAHSPWLAQVDRLDSEHVRSTTVSVSGSPDLVFDTIHTEVSGELPLAEIVAGDMTSIIDAIDAAAQSDARALEAMLLEHYRSITDATGNVVKTGGEPLTHETILTLVEKMEIEFDEAGHPQFEIIGINSGNTFAKLEAMTPAQDAAWNAMIERKRQAWNERRRRRLTVSCSPATVSADTSAESAAPPFAATEYDRAAGRLIHAYLDVRSSDFAPSLKLFPRIETEVVRPSTVTGDTGDTVTVHPIRVRGAVIPDYAMMVTGSCDALRETLDELARSRAQQLVAFWQANAGRAPGAGGIHLGIQPLTWDRLMDVMEDVSIGFDDEGNPTMRLVAGSAVSALGEPTRAQAQRFNALLERKREEYRARRSRRLVA